ncbi:hypothetical protein JIP62_03805 [Brevundimonas vitis]|uniref:Uncharacterized protein n=1 Tax=Brevundimonas vitisensis TaxID=2800818 RepID=A0ABX7BNU1_9CAUL|nr:hypothetical protein [Brevundimonas vitisensis]QQQ19250.1 hypothetical protein JIP62_03805 [Brevundimonas vitisensis]
MMPVPLSQYAETVDQFLSIISLESLIEPFKIFVTVSTVIAAFMAARYAYRINVRNKRFDIILSCNSRYDTLYQDRINISNDKGPDDINVKQYFGRYWGLKSDQFEYWLAGGVDPQTFSNWLMSTLRSFQNDSHVGRLSYRDSWNLEKTDIDIINKSFVDFMDTIKDIAVDCSVSADEKYYVLLHAMDAIEKREEAFNRFLFDGLPTWIRGRLTVRELAKTFPKATRLGYETLATRRPNALVEE